MAVLIPPDPPLVGGRVRLRPFRLDDAGAVAAACQDPSCPDGWLVGVARFAITLAPSDRCVGQVGIGFQFRDRRAEAFYWLDRAVRGRGLACEALDLVTAWVLRDHDVVRVHLITHLENRASHAVAGRCGYTREGVLRAWHPIKDTQPDVIMWSRLARDPQITAPPAAIT
jgi:RimJ/RimL family protein N-acetyltransferase